MLTNLRFVVSDITIIVVCDKGTVERAVYNDILTTSHRKITDSEV